MERKLTITTFGNVKTQHGKIEKLKWSEFINKHFMKIPVVSDKKNTACYVGGEIENADRSQGHNKVLYRDLIVLDVDGIEVKNKKALPLIGAEAKEFIGKVKKVLEPYNFLIHTTYSSSEEHKKYRIIIPLTESITDPEIYKYTVLYICNQIGVQYFDDACAVVNQLMFFPSKAREDVKCGICENKGEYFDHNNIPQNVKLQNFVNSASGDTKLGSKSLLDLSADTALTQCDSEDAGADESFDKIHEGHRDDEIFKKACSYRIMGLGVDEALILCYVFNREICIPPLDNAQVKKCVVSAYKNEMPWLKKKKSGELKIILAELAEELNKNRDYIVDKYLLYNYKDGYWKADWNDIDIRFMLSHNEVYLPKCLSNPTIKNNIVQELKDRAMRVSHPKMNLHTQRVVNFKNGVFNVDYEKIDDHDFYKNMYLTKQIAWDYIEPEVKLEDTVSYRFLLDLMSNAENVQMFMEFVGYSMVNDESFQQMLFLKGPGGIGKSTVLDIIVQNIFGADNISNVSLETLANDKWGTYCLMNKYVNICGDISAKSLEETALIKQITGEDYIKAEQKGKDPIFFKNTAKLIFSANCVPYNKSEQSDAFYRRLIIIPCKKTRYISDLGAKLKREIEAIIYYCLQAYLKIKDNKSVTISSDCMYEINKIWEESDSVKAFLNHCVVAKQGACITVKDIYDKYVDWCDEEERSNEKKSRKNFKNILGLNGYEIFEPTSGINKNIQCVKNVEVTYTPSPTPYVW